MKLYYLTVIGCIATITLVTWYMMLPPRNHWIFAMGGTALIACLGIIRYKQRAGHYDR